MPTTRLLGFHSPRSAPPAEAARTEKRWCGCCGWSWDLRVCGSAGLAISKVCRVSVVSRCQPGHLPSRMPYGCGGMRQCEARQAAKHHRRAALPSFPTPLALVPPQHSPQVLLCMQHGRQQAAWLAAACTIPQPDRHACPFRDGRRCYTSITPAQTLGFDPAQDTTLAPTDGHPGGGEEIQSKTQKDTLRHCAMYSSVLLHKQGFTHTSQQ